MAKDSESDRALFRAAVNGVRRIRTETEPVARARPAPEARFTRRDEARVLDDSLYAEIDPATLETGDELCYRRPGTRERVLRRLRRGRYVIQAEIDLHGHTVAEARAALGEFLHEALALGQRCVRIVHGKGHRSGHRGPVLKGKVDLWLRRREDVVAFASAPPTDGGTGAVYVLLAYPRGTSAPRES